MRQLICMCCTVVKLLEYIMDEDYNTYIQIYTCRILKIFTIGLFDSRGEIILFRILREFYIFTFERNFSRSLSI